MGAGSSSMASGAKGYSVRAQSSKKIADEILTLMFKKTDFKDLLQLTNLQACSKYVFTTASALSSLFQSMKVYPKLGKEGEILFAPVAELAPGLIKNGSSQTPAELSKRIEQRNRLCIDIAYFYIRLFQIYGALALTVMNADPTRGIQFTKVSVSGTRLAPLQSGGVILTSTMETAKKIKTAFQNSPFHYFDRFFSAIDRDGVPTLVLKGSDSTRVIELTWGTGDVLSGYYYVKSTRNPITLEITVRSIERDGFMDLEAEGYGILMRVYKGGLYSHKLIDEEEEENPKLKTDSLQYLSYRMQKILEGALSESGAEAPKMVAPAAPSLAAPATRPSVIPVTAGKSVFEGFEELKKIYAAKTSTVGFVFPKAYCIARAMTLLNPIFSEELPKALTSKGPQPVTETQVCNAKYDFELGGDDYMPRAGKSAGANLYFKSFVALFYDTYTIGGGSIEFTQSENGRSLLRNASTLLAKLYFIKEPAQQAAFLTSQTRLTGFSLCGDKAKGTVAARILLKPELRNKMFNEIILPMLKHQEDHTVKVNALLKKMFIIKGEVLQLNTKLLNGDRAALNSLGYEAHQLLLDYYLKSEGYYIKGILMMQNNLPSIQFI